MVVELQGPMSGKNTATVLEVGGNSDCGWRALAFMIAAQNANRNVTTTEQLIDKMDALLKPWEQRWPTTSCPSTMGTSLGPRPKCNFTLARAKRTHLWDTVLVDDLFEFSSFNARLKDCMHLDHLRFRVWPNSWKNRASWSNHFWWQILDQFTESIKRPHRWVWGLLLAEPAQAQKIQLVIWTLKDNETNLLSIFSQVESVWENVLLGRWLQNGSDPQHQEMFDHFLRSGFKPSWRRNSGGIQFIWSISGIYLYIYF